MGNRQWALFLVMVSFLRVWSMPPLPLVDAPHGKDQATLGVCILGLVVVVLRSESQPHSQNVRRLAYGRSHLPENANVDLIDEEELGHGYYGLWRAHCWKSGDVV